MSSWIRCEDGSWLNEDSINRLFKANDITVKGWQVKASVSGPAHPFVIASGISDGEKAQQYLDDIVGKLIFPPCAVRLD